MFISNTLKSNSLKSTFKFILAAGIVVSSFSACTSEAVEETRNQTTNQQETVSSNSESNYKTTQQARIDVSYFVGNWNMIPSHSSDFSYFLQLDESGSYAIALLTNGTSQDIAKGTWSIDSPNGDSKNFLHLENFYAALYPSVGVDALPNSEVLDSFEIIEMSKNTMTISNSYAVSDKMSVQQIYFTGDFTLEKK